MIPDRAPADELPAVLGTVDTAEIDCRWPGAVVSQEVESSLLLQPGVTVREARKTRSDAGKPRPVLALSKSEIETLRRCPALYALSYGQGRRPAFESNEAGDWGNWVHRSLAQAYRVLRRGLPLSVAAALALRQLDRRGLEAQGREYAPPASPFTHAMLRAVIRGYLATWGESDARDFEVLGVERRYELPALDPDGAPRRRFAVDGVIDLVLSLRATGAVTILDHKTTTSDFERDEYWIGAEFDAQALGYVDVAHRLGLPASSFVWDMIKKPGLARAEKPTPGETPDAFEARMLALILGNPDRYYARRPIQYEEWQIQRARRDVLAAGEEVLWRRRTNNWPLNRGGCRAFGSVCGWIRVCKGEVRGDDEVLFPLKVKRKEGER